MSHTQIGPAEWPVITRMLRAGYAGAEIARTLGKDSSSVNRHIAEYGAREGYDAREVRRRKRMKRIAAMDCIRVLKGTLLHTVVQELKKRRIDERPARRGRLGDWEGDTMQGRDKRLGFKSPRHVFLKK